LKDREAMVKQKEQLNALREERALNRQEILARQPGDKSEKQENQLIETDDSDIEMQSKTGKSTPKDPRKRKNLTKKSEKVKSKKKVISSDEGEVAEPVKENVEKIGKEEDSMRDSSSDEKPTVKSVIQPEKTEPIQAPSRTLTSFSRFSSNMFKQGQNSKVKLSDLLQKTIQTNDITDIYQEENISQHSPTNKDANSEDITSKTLAGAIRPPARATKLDFLSYINQPVFTDENPSPFIDCSIYKTDEINKENTLEKCVYQIKEGNVDFVGRTGCLNFHQERVDNPGKKRSLRQSVFEDI